MIIKGFPIWRAFFLSLQLVGDLTTNRVSSTIIEFLSSLDYEYMLVMTIVSYGLYYAKNFQWINRYFSPVSKKGSTRGVWILGLAFALLEIVRYLPLAFEDFWKYYKECVSIFYSFIVFQVFVDKLVLRLNKWLGFIDKKE